MKQKVSGIYRKLSILLVLSFIITLIIPANVPADELETDTETVKAAWYEDSYL